MVASHRICAQRTDSGKLGAHMYNHDNGHNQGQYMHKVVCRLEDERVCDLNRPRVALGLDAHAIRHVLVAHEGAQWYRSLCAYRLKVAEAHGRGLCGVYVVCRSG